MQNDASPPKLSFRTQSLAFAIGLTSYWLPLVPTPGACSGNESAMVVQLVVLFLLGILSGAHGMQRRILTDGGKGYGSGWLLHLVLSEAKPDVFTCSHQMLPFEVILIAGFILLPTWLGCWVGRRFLTGYVAVVKPAALLLAIVALITIPWAGESQLRKQEARARQTVMALGKAQKVYAEQHPEKGYACRFAELGPDIASVIPTSETEDNVWKDGYHYQLACIKSDAGHTDAFTLVAAPFCAHDCGNIAYCMNDTLQVGSMSRTDQPGWWMACLKQLAGRKPAVPG
ncbi:hypothetical protein [Leeia oryzae]|uniref:hypothetical protein n=1 Tax=Leeia oryzae TaxID=356662 RepID=UPI000365D566|nr:hypothetical protein [Leeia oryzae]